MQKFADVMWVFNVRLFGWRCANMADSVLYKLVGWSAWCSTRRE